MSTPGATELLIVLVIVLLILGPKRLPSLGRQLGGGIREFRRSFGAGDDSRPGDAGITSSPEPARSSAQIPEPAHETASGELDSERRSV